MRLADFHDCFHDFKLNIFMDLTFIREVWEPFQTIMNSLDEVRIPGCECNGTCSLCCCSRSASKITKVADFLCSHIVLEELDRWVRQHADLRIPDEPHLSKWTLRVAANRVAPTVNHKRSRSVGGASGGCGQADQLDHVPPGRCIFPLT